MPASIRPGDVLADRYRLVDLLSESGDGRFWRAHDRVLERHVALHVISADDPRAEGLLAAARRSATVLDAHILRVLDAERSAGLCYVVNEWGSGTSLDIMLATGGPLAPRRAAWLVGEVAAACCVAHAAGVPHGRLNPENLLVDTSGAVRVIGWSVDAALHGCSEGSAEGDVVDLAGLLYAALTGRWAGRSGSAVPPAPTDHDRVLRPRQVRAGIPRELDTLCDEVLHPRPGRSVPASQVRQALEEFVGDPVGIQESMVSRLVSRGHETVVLPQVPEFAVRDPHADSAGPASPAGATTAPDEGPEEVPDEGNDGAPDGRTDDGSTGDATGEVTQAELPGFLAAPGARPASPPPPFEEPPARPLFAPDPPEGAPVRRSRVPAPSTGSASYWPWDTDAGHHTGHPGHPGHTGYPTGSHGLVDTGWPTGTGPVVDDEVPGRNTFRLAAVLLAAMVVLVAVVVAFNLGRGRTPLGTVPEDQGSASPSDRTSAAPARPLDVAGVNDLDPQGEDGEENPDSLPLVVDGDPATIWRTATYLQDFGPAGLKTGVGLVLDLGNSQEVRAVDLQLVGAPTEVSLFLTEQAPGGDPVAGGLEPVAEVSGGPEETVELDEPTPGRYLTVWFTDLPEVPDGWRAEVAEIVVRG
ncbi:protein kinase family protein [Nocardioides sp.]|uniref:protein kinase family protein n=1 Tax=Nocardioides sp. TaxID=35761 RepID=UPI0026254501|nr:protein kinase family protein [Nocardioides sp.]